MTERKLTPEQIDNLFELCEFHNVYYYDVQLELVDHLASAIEQKWETDPELSFEEAVFRVCEQFGVDAFFHSSYESLLPPISGKKNNRKSEFEAIVEAKEKELRRKYDRLQWKYFGEFFKLPKIILTIAITFALFFILRLSNNDVMMSYCIEGFYIISLAIFLIFISPKKIRLNIVTGKSFLLYEQFRNTKRGALSIGLSFFNMFPLINRINFVKFDFPFSNYFNPQLLTAFLITLFGIMAVGLCVYTPQRIKADFTREFPQFVKS